MDENFECKICGRPFWKTALRNGLCIDCLSKEYEKSEKIINSLNKVVPEELINALKTNNLQAESVL